MVRTIPGSMLEGEISPGQQTQHRQAEPCPLQQRYLPNTPQRPQR